MSAPALPSPTAPAGGLWPKRYELVDGFRGVAALMVVAFHQGFLALGYLGVPLFFVISGYCILASAESCRKHTSGVWEFTVRRFHRIYPPYLCALVFFIITRLIKIPLDHENQLAQYSALQFLQNATLTQWLTVLFHPNLTADNPTLMVAAFWSLNYEVQFYVVVGLALFLAMRGFASMRNVILAVTGASMLWLALVPLRFGLFMEFWPVFALGCLVYLRLTQLQNRWARWSIDAFLLALVALGVLIHLGLAPRSLLGCTYPGMLVGAGFSLLLIYLRGLNDWLYPTVPGRVLAYLGMISYSLYLIHQFNLVLANHVVGHLLTASAPQWAVITGILLFQVGLASVFWFFCERPFLNSHQPAKKASRVSQPGQPSVARAPIAAGSP